MIQRHLRRALLALVAMLAVLGLVESAAAAEAASGAPAQAACEGPAIRARVQDDTAAGKTPLAGVSVTVTGADGAAVGTAVTDDKGVAEICLPDKIDVTVSLDESTLPDGKELRSEAEVPVAGDSFITTTKSINFFTGESAKSGDSFANKLAQRLTDGLRLGLVISMCSVGLSLIFGTTGLTNFAHGEMVTFGALMGYLLNVTGLSFLAFLPLVDSDGRFPMLLAAPLAVVLGGASGLLLDWGLFARLRKRGIGLISQMVITVGLSIMFRNAFQFFFGGRTRPYRDFSNQVATKYGPISITPRDLIVSILAVVVLLAVALVLQYTRVGKATRAVSDNPDLASATGINSASVIRWVWIAGAALAAMGGVFRGLDEQVAFNSGGRLLFLMFAAITLGGLGSAYGALVGGILVGVLVEVATVFGVPSELKTTPALLILILVLLLRPQGILGRRQRVG